MRNFPSLQRVYSFCCWASEARSNFLPAFRHDGLGGRALDRDGGGVGVAGLRLRHRLGHGVQEVDESGLPVRSLARFHFSILLQAFARLRRGDERSQVLVVFLKEVLLLRRLIDQSVSRAFLPTNPSMPFISMALLFLAEHSLFPIAFVA